MHSSTLKGYKLAEWGTFFLISYLPITFMDGIVELALLQGIKGGWGQWWWSVSPSGAEGVLFSCRCHCRFVKSWIPPPWVQQTLRDCCTALCDASSSTDSLEFFFITVFQFCLSQACVFEVSIPMNWFISFPLFSLQWKKLNYSIFIYNR